MRVPGFGKRPDKIGQPSITTSIPAKKNRKKRLALMVVIAVIIIAGIVAYFIFMYFHNTSKPSVNQLTTAKQIQNNASWQKIVNNNLAKNDYEQYQMQLTSVASQYVDNGNYTSAAKVMDQLFANVPADKIDASTYYQAISIANGQHDTAKKKEYVSKLVALLNKEGQTAEAAYVQKNLGSD